MPVIPIKKVFGKWGDKGSLIPLTPTAPPLKKIHNPWNTVR
jgi:hypothetical protein